MTPDPTLALWRASQAFRLVALAYALTFQLSSYEHYTHQTLSWIIYGFMLVWSGVAGSLLVKGSQRPVLVACDQVIMVGLMLSSWVVAPVDWYTNNQTVPTTLWVTNAVISAAIAFGPWVGLVSACVLAGVSLWVQGRFDIQLWRDATAPMMISAGIAMGMASRVAVRAHEQLRRAARLAAASEERERLARQVHDGVLQVLAFVRRRAEEIGAEVGGEAAVIARMAGEQEIALRNLISGVGEISGMGEIESRDLGVLLRQFDRPGVVVSTPAEPVVLESAAVVAAAVENALANTELHAGPASSFVLLEDLGSTVVVTVRDDGVGIAPGRLAEAEAQGRMGVSKSIRGRIEALAGRAILETEEGGGVEWEFRIPRSP